MLLTSLLLYRCCLSLTHAGTTACEIALVEGAATEAADKLKAVTLALEKLLASEKENKTALAQARAELGSLQVQ